MSSIACMARRFSIPSILNVPVLRKPRTVFHGAGTELPSEVAIEEELAPRYDAKFYFPVEPGCIFNQRFEALAKLGWGSCSTVWLVRDIRR